MPKSNQIMALTESTVEKLKNKGIRLTPQRLAICELIFDNITHPSAEEIFQTVKATFPTISLATVYKTFNLLKNKNLVTEIPYGTFSRFDPKQDIHVNIICPECNSIKDLESDNILKFYEKLNNELGGGIEDQQFNIFKKCPKCSSIASK